jgi:uncharacterized protein YfkK (UPF0435 family)
MKIKRKELADMITHIEDSLRMVNNILDDRDYESGVLYAVEVLQDVATNLEIYLKK